MVNCRLIAVAFIWCVCVSRAQFIFVVRLRSLLPTLTPVDAIRPQFITPQIGRLIFYAYFLGATINVLFVHLIDSIIIITLQLKKNAAYFGYWSGTNIQRYRIRLIEH